MEKPEVCEECGRRVPVTTWLGRWYCGWCYDEVRYEEEDMRR